MSSRSVVAAPVRRIGQPQQVRLFDWIRSRVHELLMHAECLRSIAVPRADRDAGPTYPPSCRITTGQRDRARDRCQPLLSGPVYPVVTDRTENRRAR